jgi:hypothetical protein
MTGVNVLKMYRKPQSVMGTIVMMLTVELKFGKESPWPKKAKKREPWTSLATDSATTNIYHPSIPSHKYW